MRAHLTDVGVKALKAAEHQFRVWDTKTPGFGVLVGRTKSWICMYGPKRKLKVLGKCQDMPLAEARKAAKALLLEKSGKLPSKTFGDALDRYYALHLPTLRPSTAYMLKNLMERRWRKWGRRDLDDLTPQEIVLELDTLTSTPTERCKAFKELRAFYPPEHVALVDEIVVEGAAISEMPLAWEPRARDFPRRNRLISGLAVGVVIVEAARRSGSLITARMAGEQGREVFAVPGSPLDPRAEGTNGLIKQGAIMVTEASDVIAALEPILGRGLDLPAREPETPSSADVEPGDDERARIVSLLGPTPAGLDDLVRLSQSTPAIVRTVLLELEIAGRLERHGGGLVSLV